MKLTPEDVAHFHEEGYLPLRGLLNSTESDAYFRELKGLIQTVFSDPRDPPHQWAPAMTSKTPIAVNLLATARFADLAEQLLGRAVLAVGTDATVYAGDTPWHHDALACEGCETIKFALYADCLNTDTGALRVLPGSHCKPPQDISVAPVALATEPGDAIVFDVRLWHASFGGQRRLAGSLNYRIDPATSDETQRTQAYFATTYRRFQSLYGGELYPEEWRTFSNPRYSRWMERMAELGVLPSSTIRT